MNHIKVSDKYGKYNNWEIEYDMGDYYEVFHKNFITVLSKSKCFMFEGKMMSSEIRTFHEDDDNSTLRTTGSEQCSVCFRDIYSTSKLNVLKNSDKYICKKCAKSLKMAIKSARI